MGKLVAIVLFLGVILLLGLDWASRSETAYYLFYHLRDMTGDLFGLWTTPKSTKLVDEGPFSTRVIWQIVLSVLIAALSLYVILSNRHAFRQQNWAYGAIGILVGFWLRA